MHEKADECKALIEKVADQSTEMEKSKKEREFEVTKLKKDVKVIQEKLDSKAKELDEKTGRRDDKYSYHGKNGVSKLTDDHKEELKKLKEEKEKVHDRHSDFITLPLPSSVPQVLSFLFM